GSLQVRGLSINILAKIIAKNCSLIVDLDLTINLSNIII
ncbi:MAG: hypothetical protein ACI93V_001175, partial [Alteromonadaceae bacterium]